MVERCCCNARARGGEAAGLVDCSRAWASWGTMMPLEGGSRSDPAGVPAAGPLAVPRLAITPSRCRRVAVRPQGSVLPSFPRGARHLHCALERATGVRLAPDPARRASVCLTESGRRAARSLMPRAVRTARSPSRPHIVGWGHRCRLARGA
eukprot:scaffold1518_cov417-Prasinococcus_capsulatus_cf.AAC.43